MDFLYGELTSVNSLDDIVATLNELNVKVNAHSLEINNINTELEGKQDTIESYLKSAELGDNNTLRIVDNEDHVLIYPQE